MKTIFYWCPYLSRVATVSNVINSAISIIKYNKNFKISFIDTSGEWNPFFDKLISNNIAIEKITSFNLRSQKIGFLKSRFYLSLLFLLNFFPLVKILKKNQPSFLIIHLLTSLPLILLCLFSFKTKFILRISGLPKLNFFRKFLWKLASDKIYRVTCPSEETLNDLKKLNIFENRKLVVLYDPIINISLINEKKKMSISPLPHNNYFLNIGRLTNQKNQNLLVVLFFDLVKKNDKLILYIIGSGENKINLTNKIKKLNLHKNIFLLGYKHNIFPYFEKATAVISSSLWEDPGAVMVESAYCNTTIISSDCPNGPSEFISENKGGYLFKNNDKESLKKTFELLINDSGHNIYKKKLYAKKKSKKYTCFYHYKRFKEILDD